MTAISVVMPLYNKADTVARAIRSVLAQTMEDFDLLVIDDGSTDAGPEIIRTFDDDRIKMKQQPNAGVSAARNAGIRAAQTDVIAFLDADDEWRTGFLAAILDLRESHPDCAVYATSYEIRSGGTARQATLRGLPKGFRKGVLENYFLVASRSDPPLWSSALALRRDAVEEIGGFPVGIHSGEDLLTWARLAVKHKIAYSVQPLAIYWAPEGAKSRPRRIPTVPDQVGTELELLLESQGPTRSEGIRDYLAMWHRIRGAAFLHFADGRHARREFGRALELGPWSTGLVALWAISALPGPSARYTYLALRRLYTR